MVQRNLTWGDATFRGLFGLVLAIIAMDAIILLNGDARWAVTLTAAVLSVAMIATSVSGFCPVYRAFGRTQAPVKLGWDN